MISHKLFAINNLYSMPANLLEEILLLIKTSVSDGVNIDELLFKSKFILTELLTNAIKHANANEVELSIEIANDFVRFKKQDKGNQLVLPQTKHHDFENAIIVTTDIMHTLYAIEKESATYFYCHENAVPVIDTNNDFPEHFGLLIITKAADEFSYHYDSQKHANTFTAKVNF